MIEVATLTHVPRLAALGALMHVESDYRERPYDEAKVRALLASLIEGDDGVVFIATRGGEIVGGMAGGVSGNWFNDDRIAFEYGLFIEPAARHGITALKLVAAFTAWAERRGAQSVRVGITTGVNVEGTSALYRLAGYRDSGVFFTKEF